MIDEAAIAFFWSLYAWVPKVLAILVRFAFLFSSSVVALQ